MAALVGIAVGFTIVDRSSFPNGSHKAIVRVVSHLAKLVPVNDAAHQLDELPDLKLVLGESGDSAVISNSFGWEDGPAEQFGALFGEPIRAVRHSASALSNFPQLSKWFFRVKLLLGEKARVVSLHEGLDRQCRGTPKVFNDDLKRAVHEICGVFPVASFEETNGLSDLHGFDANPRTVASSQCIVGGIGGFLRGIRLVFGRKSQVVGVRYLLLHFLKLQPSRVSLLCSRIGLFPGSYSQIVGILPASVHFVPLQTDEQGRNSGHKDGKLSPSQSRFLKAVRLLLDSLELFCGCWLACWGVDWLGYLGWRQTAIGFGAIFGGLVLVVHGGFKLIYRDNIVAQKCLTNLYYCTTVIDMANVLNQDRQIAIIGALAEGSTIRSIERITGVHRDTIMRLGVKVGRGCAKMLDSSMRNLPCNRLEMDEIWGFVGKKDRNVREGEDAVGSVWTFCAIDAETKLVPAFKCGDRDAATAKAFVEDVASRMAYRVQISTDGLNAYVAAMESAFGGNVDYAQIIKTYGHEEVSNNRRYSAPEFVSSEKKIVVGNPDERLISTSYIERLNATTRLHMRRLTRLTLAFSKKRENFEAAVALHFAYYNFVKRHNTIRCTPAMAAGVTGSFWSVGDLLEAAA